MIASVYNLEILFFNNLNKNEKNSVPVRKSQTQGNLLPSVKVENLSVLEKVWYKFEPLLQIFQNTLNQKF